MDTFFFWMSKILWPLLSPLNFVLLLLSITWLLSLSKGKQWARNLFACILLVLFSIAFLPIGSWLIYPLEKRFVTTPDLPESIEGIVVLSGAIKTRHSLQWEQVEYTDAVERDLSFIKLARDYPHAQLIYTGGSSSITQQEYKSADVAKVFFEEMGLDTSRIKFERDARNTWENAKLSFEIAEPALGQEWILITSAYHMPRSMGIFCKIGWPMIPYPVDHQSISIPGLSISFNLGGHMEMLDKAIHEWVGLLVYWLTGKTNDLLPGKCKLN